MIKVLIADEQKIHREGMLSILSNDPEINVVGEASNGKEIVSFLSSQKADVVILDVNMPEMNGLETTKYLKEHFPEIKVLVLTRLEHEHYVSQFFESGAKAYLIRNIDKATLVNTIKKIHMGDTFLSPEITQTIVKNLKDNAQGLKNGIPLTKREIEVLYLIAEGLTNQEIADKFSTSRRTIESHRKNLIEKTGVKNTASLIKYAFTNGLMK